MPRRTMIKMGLIGLALFALAGIVAAQSLAAADRVLLLQAKRFEGTYKLSSGETTLKMNDSDAEWKIESGAITLKAALAPQAGKPHRATLNVDGRTVEGKAEIEGRTLTMEFKDGKTAYVLKLTLTGRNDGEIEAKKDEKALVSGTIKRA